MEALVTDKDISIKNDNGNENNSELLIEHPNLNDHDNELNYEKKDDMDIPMNFNDQDKLDVPSLVEICKQQLIVILKDMCADSNNSDEKASFMYHLNRLRSAVTVVDLHNYIAVFGPCLSYNKLPSTWNISVCDYLKQQLNILRAADSQQNSNNFMNYYELHNDFDDVINEKKMSTNNSIQGNINSNNINSQSSMKGTMHMNSTNNSMNYSFCDQDDKMVEDYYECLMRTKLSEESPDCLKYMMNTKNDSLSNTEVENVISYLKKYEVKSNKNSNKMEDDTKYNKDSDYDYQEEYLKDKALYDSDIDEQHHIENSMHNNRTINDNVNNLANNNTNTNNNNNNNTNNSNVSNKNGSLKSDRMKKNDVNNWTRSNTEGHPEYLPRIPGVRFNPKKQQWLAAWNDNTREIRRYFSVKQYGFEQARILAVKARQEAEKAGARCKPMFHVHGRKAVDTLSNDIMKNDMEENYNNTLSNNAIGNDLLNKKELIKSENKGLKRGRGRPPKRKLSEDSQLSLDDVEQNFCRNNENMELMECMESFDKDCTRPMKGVSYNDRKGSWLAYWSIGKNFQMRRFPIKKLGFEKAKELAIQCRLEAEQAGATTTENRTKRMRNLLTLNSDNTLEAMMEHNSLENDENLNDKNVNGNILVSQMQNFGNTTMNNNIPPTKMPHSDEQESEIDFSPTKRTRAPRGRRMESLTARASALTPVEGVRFDPYSYSWFAKYLENENSKEPKISKYLLKKWGFNKAHSLAVHTVKCAYKAVPFTDEELINIFNVDAKNLINNQNSLINLGFNDTFHNNNNNMNNNNLNTNNFNNINNNNSNNNIMNNLNIMNNTINSNMDNNINNNFNNINSYNGNTNSISIINNNLNNNIDNNVDNSNINSNNKVNINNSSGSSNNNINSNNNNNNLINNNNNDLNINTNNKINIMNNYAFNNNNNMNNDNVNNINNYNINNNNAPKTGNIISSNLISSNLNNSLKTNIGNINNMDNNKLSNFMNNHNINNNNYCPGEILNTNILDENHINMINANSKVDNSSNSNNNTNVINSNSENHMNINGCILNNNVIDYHNQNNNIKISAHLTNVVSSNPVDNIMTPHINEIPINHTNDANVSSVDANYNISSNNNNNNSNINSENAINSETINLNSNDINNEKHTALNNIEHPMDNRNILNIINEQTNLDNNSNIDNSNSYSNNHYSKNPNNNFNSYTNDSANANNLINTSQNEPSDSSLYYMNVKPEIKTEQ
ncbi:transcription factor with AP2 domain(s), putative [Plasmodium relictum]|uniref:Transcription factor with AP2 domain(S), putative n=2 Tax=Plasmodium relictum TaxID=85471 RepID=A0A1J1H3Z6_PLARL|nr:transcription factor with AP2 domain(s), putative [Plasmodium relictum]CRG99628.1 transcription factor with AP2 domain(s), putative [Plasmodium relictum]